VDRHLGVVQFNAAERISRCKDGLSLRADVIEAACSTAAAAAAL
jgi:hypothetical protein